MRRRARRRWRRSPRASGESEGLGRGHWGEATGFHQTVAQTSHAIVLAKRGPPLAWIMSLLSPAPLRGLFPRLSLARADQEIFQDELAIHRRKGMFAYPAMEQSMREVGVSFNALSGGRMSWPKRGVRQELAAGVA
jgi:hypothetical protein